MASGEPDPKPARRQSGLDSIGEAVKAAFPAYLIMRGAAFIVAIAVTLIGGFGWVFQTTLNGYDVAFATMSSRIGSLDTNLHHVNQTVQKVDDRLDADNHQMKSDLRLIKKIVTDNAEMMKNDRSGLDEIRNSLHENREKTAHLFAIVERLPYETIAPAAGPESVR